MHPGIFECAKCGTLNEWGRVKKYIDKNCKYVILYLNGQQKENYDPFLT